MRAGAKGLRPAFDTGKVRLVLEALGGPARFVVYEPVGSTPRDATRIRLSTRSRLLRVPELRLGYTVRLWDRARDEGRFIADTRATS